MIKNSKISLLIAIVLGLVTTASFSSVALASGYVEDVLGPALRASLIENSGDENYDVRVFESKDGVIVIKMGNITEGDYICMDTNGVTTGINKQDFETRIDCTGKAI